MALTGILLDTNAYSAYKVGAPEAVDIVQHVHRIYISPIVLGELLGGFLIGSKQDENLKDLLLFLKSPRIKILPIDDTIASHYAAIYNSLRARGKPIPTNDMWIAATALRHNIGVLMNVSFCSSANACCNSSCVFITIGPYHATGSLIGLPETRMNRIPSSPA